MIKKNFFIILVVAILYIINQNVKSEVPGVFLSWYFNDIICGTGFIAYCNIFIELWKRPLKKLIGIEAVLLCAGLVWEVGAPMVVPGSVGDFCDIIAYTIGGFIYWFIINLHKPEKE
ncbi:MAG: hypothetical protein II354_02825 [Firmicutes bacterium]|nr:hypothetical protein [Bacillota bacterium]